MPVRLRLQRFGRLHKPFYHIVAANSKSPRDGKHLEKLGTYDPIPDRHGNKHIRFDVERVYHWIKIGAEPTETVTRLLSRAQILPPAPRRGLPNLELEAPGPQAVNGASTTAEQPPPGS